MIHIGVYDDDNDSMKKLNSAFDFYVVNRNTEYDVTWFVGKQGLQKVEKYASKLHMALVSVNSKEKLDFCERLFKCNPHCRICYYNTMSISCIDITNPLWFLEEASFALIEKQNIAYKIDSLFNGFKYWCNLLIFNTRQMLYIIPVEEVAYFQSDLKYVNIKCCNGDNISIYKKLDDVEISLSDMFLRIHNSYIANRTYIKKIDKVNRITVLKNGENLPISNSHYMKVLYELSTKT